MQINLNHNKHSYHFDLDKAIDISIPPQSNVKAFHAPDFEAEPVRSGNFTGLVSEGSAVNFLNLRINPHGNGTHTECVGHITSKIISINDCLKKFHFPSLLISIDPESWNQDDLVISTDKLQNFEKEFDLYQPKACIIRTLPNTVSKRNRDYSDSNPPYFLAESIHWLNNHGVEHLLTDLPSVDREDDEGKLLAHKEFWNFPENPQLHKTITEMVYVPNAVSDGFYLLTLQIISLDTDASPSKPVLFSPV